MFTRAIKQFNWHNQPGLCFFLFSLSAFLIRIFLRGSSLELDEAEQVVVAQQLLSGYPNQPPLYSWLQYGVFQLLGVNLYSLALLKYSLLFGSLYYFHKICEIHCLNNRLAWCATLAWVFIPAISLDLLKDNTHSVLALFAACLTWYWFIAPAKLSKLTWYTILGCIIGIGFLSKFNYYLFLGILIISAISLKNYRDKILNPGILLTLFSALLIAGPYFLWLIYHNGNNGNPCSYAIYKLIPNGELWWNGPIQLLKTTSFFALPVLIIVALFFPLNRRLQKTTSPGALLVRYHLICLPFLISIILIMGIRDFQTRWLIPILFLCPTLFFSQVQWHEKLKTRQFLLLCLLVQFLFLATLVGRSQFNKKYQQFPLEQIMQSMQNDGHASDLAHPLSMHKKEIANINEHTD